MDILLMLSGFILSLILIVMYKRELRKSQNKVHFYVARDKDGVIYLYMGKPVRELSEFLPCHYGKLIKSSRHFSKYGLNEDDYNYLKWEDEPVEVFLNLEN